MPSWSQVEAILTQMYLQQLARWTGGEDTRPEIEAVRFDLNEVHADTDAVDEVESIEIKSPEGSQARQPLTAWDDSMNDHIPDTHEHIDYNELPPSDRGAYDFTAKALLAGVSDKRWIRPGIG
ncbi:hypothetical protein HBA53_24680 (plasmid) [Rhodococcus pyridinivorans]|uniref:hypothetical protein n=1 Tax=Rhodococcus pyridinivorans TaxID=103816 RepID=UPI001C2F2133|nr:hypothetical protein [Rhodococcus pyridinivorans]QXF84303.1 hypothetical protein HBA53_24680 [Rhodococcus pyridinivorans]